MDVHEDDDTEKDNIKVLHNFTKQDTKVAEIKSLGFVHRTSKNISTNFQETVFFSKTAQVHMVADMPGW